MWRPLSTVEQNLAKAMADKDFPASLYGASKHDDKRRTSSLHELLMWDHMRGAATGARLIALDMYEHSDHMDYGTKAARYVDAVMANLAWEVVNARYRAALA